MHGIISYNTEIFDTTVLTTSHLVYFSDITREDSRETSVGVSELSFLAGQCSHTRGNMNVLSVLYLHRNSGCGVMALRTVVAVRGDPTSSIS